MRSQVVLLDTDTTQSKFIAPDFSVYRVTGYFLRWKVSFE